MTVEEIQRLKREVEQLKESQNKRKGMLEQLKKGEATTDSKEIKKKVTEIEESLKKKHKEYEKLKAAYREAFDNGRT